MKNKLLLIPVIIVFVFIFVPCETIWQKTIYLSLGISGLIIAIVKTIQYKRRQYNE